MADISLFNILVSVLMLVVGFLLNRVFAEIDKIRAATSDINAMVLKDFVAKADFVRHSEAETRTMEKMSTDIGRRFDKLDVLLEAVRVKQQTRTGD